MKKTRRLLSLLLAVLMLTCYIPLKKLRILHSRTLPTHGRCPAAGP